jgi:hypothetical protein
MVAPTVLDPVVDVWRTATSPGSADRARAARRDGQPPGLPRARERTKLRSLTGQAYIEISRRPSTRSPAATRTSAALVSPTPERVRYIAETVGGGVLRELEKAIDRAHAAAMGEKVKLSGCPIWAGSTARSTPTG